MSGATEPEAPSEGERICWKCGKHFGTDATVCPDDGSRLLSVSPADLADPLVGQLFDRRFRVYKKLGEGGMGNVYSARQIDFERDVALKILKADFLRDENIRTRFMYEARTISKLRHPNALRLFDFGQAPDGSFYMVMELLEGESLADRLAYSFVSFRDVFNIVPAICGVLFEAHENDVIHRDLKPENIFLVDVNKRDEFTKLLDFGIAKHLRDSTMTRSGTLWGTPAYMSPEQAKGDTVGAPADIYAIGIILFELISGNLPFSAETQMGLAMKHINVPARPLRSIPGLEDVVPVELDELVMQCLAKDPADRPKHAELVADRLSAIKAMYFDDAKLASIPAEEVDAIALQDWIAAEPDVSDESPLPGFDAQGASTTPTMAGVRANSPVRYSPTATYTQDSVEVASPNRNIGIAIIVLLLLVGGAIAFAATKQETNVASEANLVGAVAPVLYEDVDMRESTAGTAGAAAASAAHVVLNSRRVTEAIDSDAFLAAEIAAERPHVEQKRPTKAMTREELESVKPALERTF